MAIPDFESGEALLLLKEMQYASLLSTDASSMRCFFLQQDYLQGLTVFKCSRFDR